jgi:two-component SAPR family response regulator
MNTILVDDEIWALERFEVECRNLDDISVVGKFQDAHEALIYAENNTVDVAFIDITMPKMDGLELATRLKAIYPKMIVIYVSAHEEYMPQAFRSLTADYFILKPYREEDVKEALERARLLGRRLRKPLSISTFGRFKVLLQGKPLILSGKAKEILALLVSAQGGWLSNEEIYSTIWEDRQYSNKNMKVYHNALKRLRVILQKNEIEGLIISTARAHAVNRELFECDYYQYLEGKKATGDFRGAFLSEYSWGEHLLADLINLEHERQAS